MEPEIIYLAENDLYLVYRSGELVFNGNSFREAVEKFDQLCQEARNIICKCPQ